MLEIHNLTVSIAQASVLEEVSLSLAPGEALGIVGESGSGKSLTALALMGLLPSAARVTGGAIRFEETDWTRFAERDWRKVRGRVVSMVFQEPMSALDPSMTIGAQIGEAVRIHRRLSRAEVRAEVLRLLGLVEIPAPDRRYSDYPHQLSGGMRQRVVIAIALACNPRVLIADEPTTALDVTVQAQVMDLLDDLRKRLGVAVILISHDIALVSEFADRIAVMYAGRIVETAPADRIFAAPMHPYTKGLLAAAPTLDGPVEELRPIPGVVPSVAARPDGCVFAPRCAEARPACGARRPSLRRAGPGQEAACILIPEETPA